jgi:large subunit ribosomal protein L25
MQVITLEAKSREAGKKASRAARVAEEVPCVLYGNNVDAVSFQVPELDMRSLIYTNEFHLVNVTLGDQSWDCILKHVDFHPTTDRPIHADFQVLVTGETLSLTVPVHFEGKSVGVQDGGKQEDFVHEVAIRCLPKNIPDRIHVDVSDLKIGQSVLVRDLSIEGIEFEVPDDMTLVSVILPREIEEEEPELEGELEEGEEEGAETEDSAATDES